MQFSKKEGQHQVSTWQLGSGIGQRAARRTQARTGQEAAHGAANLEPDERLQAQSRRSGSFRSWEEGLKKRGGGSSPQQGFLPPGRAVLLLAFIAVYCYYMH